MSLNEADMRENIGKATYQEINRELLTCERDEDMNRIEQFEILENMFTWDVEEVGHFTIAFYAHYQLLNSMLENCADRFKRIDIPRVDYLFYREFIYIIYTELCVTIETLLKSLMEDSEYAESEIRKKGHNLNALLIELGNKDIPKINEIRGKLQSHQEVINYLVDNNIFVDARYMSYKEDVSLMHINKIRGLIIDLDSIYEKYYRQYNWIDLVYPDTM